MEPSAIVTALSSSAVPCVNELSVAPLGLSVSVCRPATLAQSVCPDVSTIMLPSFPSNVLPVRFAPDAATNATPKTVATTTVAPKRQYRRPCRRRNVPILLIYGPLLRALMGRSTLLAQPDDTSGASPTAAAEAGRPSNG